MATTDITQEDILAYRAGIFVEMGFSEMQAAILSVSRDSDGWFIDSHKVRKTIEAGCSHNLAMRIFQ